MGVVKKLIVILSLFAFGCATAQPTQQASTMPEPVNPIEMPEAPERPEHRIVLPVSQCTIEGSEETTPAGIYMDEGTAAYAGRLRISYDELRGLYEVDLRTREREREITERLLIEADEEILHLRQRVARTWWEREGDTVMLVVGILVGAGAVGGISVAAAR